MVALTLCDNASGRVAQSAEHTPEKRGVTGSTPVPATHSQTVIGESPDSSGVNAPLRSMGERRLVSRPLAPRRLPVVERPRVDRAHRAGGSNKAQDVRHTALTLAVGLFSFWSAIWVIGLPLMMLGEADNGKFNNDFETIWLPNFALGVVGVIVSIAMLMLEKRRPELGNRVLLPPALIAVGAAFMFVVHP